MFRGCGAVSRKAAERVDSLVRPPWPEFHWRLLHGLNWLRKGYVSPFSLWCDTAAREIVDVGTSPEGFRPPVAQRIVPLRGECRQRRHAVLIEELAHRRALRRRSGDQVLYLNNKKLTEEITQR